MRNIGVPVTNPPKQACKDVHCPFHGHLKVRGRILKGTVVSTKMVKTIVLQREYVTFDHKYRRYARNRSKVSAHLPDCMEVSEGDVVTIMECRPISKTVAFVVIDKMVKEGA
ncbi:MAG: 30S ribosomal protein S17 [Promethearchaeota archaeon]